MGLGGPNGERVTAREMKKWRKGVLLALDVCLRDLDGCLSWHGDSMEDADAIDLSLELGANANTELKALGLSRNAISDDGALAVTIVLRRRALSGAHLTALDLSENKVGESGVRSLATFLATDSRLTRLHLGGNRICARGVTCLAHSLASNGGLLELSLRDNEFAEEGTWGGEPLTHVLTHRNTILQVLDLSGNVLEVDGGRDVGNLLAINTSLTDVALAGCSMPLWCMKAALQVNTSLTCLTLSDNYGGGVGDGEGESGGFFEALGVNHTIKTLHLASILVGDTDEECEAVARALSRNTTLTDLDLRGNQFDDVGIRRAVLGNSSLIRLTLACEMWPPHHKNHHVHDEVSAELEAHVAGRLQAEEEWEPRLSGFERFEQCSVENISLSLFVGVSISDPHLTSLRLSDNVIGPAGFECLASALGRNSALTQLWLTGVGLDDDYAGDIASNAGGIASLTELDMSFNRITPSGSTDVADGLRGNTSLTSICLGGNLIGSKGAARLLGALRTSTSLVALDLCDSPTLFARGGGHLLRALARNTVLTALRLAACDIDQDDVPQLADALLWGPGGALKTALKRLDLSHNLIDDASALELLTALRQGSLTALGLMETKLSVQGVDKLLGELRHNSSLTRLDLDDSHLVSEAGDDAQTDGFAAAAQGLSCNSTLTALSLNSTWSAQQRWDLCSHGRLQRLADALALNHTIVSLDLSGAFLPSTRTAWHDERDSVLASSEIGATTLARALHGGSLRRLDLSGNRIGNGGAQEIATLLGHHTALTSLFVNSNAIEDVGATHLADALVKNTTLMALGLSGNSFEATGLESVANALLINTRLTHISVGRLPLTSRQELDERTGAKLAQVVETRSWPTSLDLSQIGGCLGAAARRALGLAIRSHPPRSPTIHVGGILGDADILRYLGLQVPHSSHFRVDDWPEERIAAALQTARSGRVLAFVMAQHPRLGAASLASMLDGGLQRMICLSFCL